MNAEGNVLYVDKRKVLFEHTIGDVNRVGERAIVLLKIPMSVDETDNVFAVSKTGGVVMAN